MLYYQGRMYISRCQRFCLYFGHLETLMLCSREVRAAGLLNSVQFCAGRADVLELASFKLVECT